MAQIPVMLGVLITVLTMMSIIREPVMTGDVQAVPVFPIPGLTPKKYRNVIQIPGPATTDVQASGDNARYGVEDVRGIAVMTIMSG